MILGVNLLTFEVDNILSTGSVIVEAWVDIGGTAALTNTIKEATYNTASLGTWISECIDNYRKLNFRQYVPKYLSEDTELYQFVTFLEDFFNTVYTEDNCNISILEKIDRIKRLYDIDKIDNKYLNYYGDTFGKELNLNLDQVKSLLNVTNVTDEVLFKYIRTLYKTIPYINQFKGSNAAIIIILKCFGCLPILIEKWISRTEGGTSMVEVSKSKLDYKKQTSYFDPRYYYQYDKLRNYYLSSHFSIDLGYDNKTINEILKEVPALYKLITGIKPISRVLDELWYTIKTYFNGYLNYNNNDIISSIESLESWRYFWNIISDKDFFKRYQNVQGVYVEDIQNGKKLTLSYRTNNTLKWKCRMNSIYPPIADIGPYFNNSSNSYELWYNIFHNLKMHNLNRLCLAWENGNHIYTFMPEQYKINILDNTIEISLYGITAQTIQNTSNNIIIWFYKYGEEIQTFNSLI